MTVKIILGKHICLMKNILIITAIFLIQSCRWLNDCLPDCGGSYDFTLNYSIPEAKDTLQVGDTLTLIHEIPFIMVENDNGIAYDIEGIPYSAIIGFNKLVYENKTLEGVDTGDLEIVEIGKGQVSLNNLSSGTIVYNIFFQELEDRSRIEVKIALKEVGEYLMYISHLETDLWSIDIPNVDTCCLSQTVFLDYHFEQQIPLLSFQRSSSNARRITINLVE